MVCAVWMVLQFLGWGCLCPSWWGNWWSHAHLQHESRDACKSRKPRYVRCLLYLLHGVYNCCKSSKYWTFTGIWNSSWKYGKCPGVFAFLANLMGWQRADIRLLTVQPTKHRACCSPKMLTKNRFSYMLQIYCELACHTWELEWPFCRGPCHTYATGCCQCTWSLHWCEMLWALCEVKGLTNI